ncbi:MAG: hypothetical protein US50_C0039G0006 [Candidatus Nomurabacteria bacterium GW2011_GWB1_37_5]|uniref:Uncharacterized protein n=1 Tax=Candidatus Nomurabacteria bacterium GW2011_GWB1_37_5 TaxID=1618742 RepID=A0A0G0H864_9BACT|nr:MAG: hypothetical protein US50_C0039G0006 [Candidatus Nomurabacteria bacterium GW2011_GWB1_37_5]
MFPRSRKHAICYSFCLLLEIVQKMYYNPKVVCFNGKNKIKKSPTD